MAITCGWMEPMVGLFLRSIPVLAVIPTAIVPLTIIGVILSAIASFIAGLFGIELKWEGPKRLLEVFLKPRVIVSIIIMNLIIWGGIRGYEYFSTRARPLWYIEIKNNMISKPNDHRKYTDVVESFNAIEQLPTQTKKIAAINSIWQLKLEKGSFGGAAFSGNSLFIGTDDGYVTEVDDIKGTVIRRFYIGTSATPRVVIWNDILFVGEGHHATHHGRIYAFDLTTGRLRSAYQTEGHTEGVPVIATVNGKTLLFVMGGASGIHAIDPMTMLAVWHQKLGHIDSEVRVEGNRVYFSRGIERDNDKRDHRAYAVDFATGKVIWETDTAASSWRAPIIFQDRVCWGMGEIFVPSNFGQFACFDKETGKPLTAINLDAPVIGIPQRLGQNIVVTADLRGNVCAVDPFSSTRLWCADLPKAKYSYATPGFDGNGNILFPSEKDGIFAIDYRTGEKVFQWKPSEKDLPWSMVMATIHTHNDYLYVIDWKGNLRKLKPEYAL
jgi:outer membrane protein assembly factor BamB